MPIPPSISCSALLINSTVGAGKTSVAEMVGDLLTDAGVPNAVIDLDWLRRSWPSPAGDRFNVAMSLRNLRSVARNYRDAGAVRIVLAGVVETRVERDRHEDVLGVPLSVCRLRVDLPLVREIEPHCYPEQTSCPDLGCWITLNRTGLGVERGFFFHADGDAFGRRLITACDCPFWRTVLSQLVAVVGGTLRNEYRPDPELTIKPIALDHPDAVGRLD